MKKKRKVEPPSGIRFESSQEDDQILKSLMDTIPEHLHLKEEDHAEEGEPSLKNKKPPANGFQTPDAILDLHGKTREEAIRMVQNFVMISHQQRLYSVLIITGKGHHSGEGGPILNQAVRDWLKQNGAPYIQNFSHAPPQHGGTGAFWINLL